MMWTWPHQTSVSTSEVGGAVWGAASVSPLSPQFLTAGQWGGARLGAVLAIQVGQQKGSPHHIGLLQLCLLRSGVGEGDGSLCSPLSQLPLTADQACRAGEWSHTGELGWEVRRETPDV